MSDNSIWDNVSDEQKAKFKTGGILAICPGLDAALNDVLMQYEKTLFEHDELEEASPESLKKIDDLFNDH
jgi:hypothetical protein